MHSDKDDEVIRKYIEEARRTGPRTTNLLPVFGRIALGQAGRPDIADAIPDPALLADDADTLAFAVYLQNFTGIFHRHLNASVPFFAEEQCRLGLAISRYSSFRFERTKRPTKFWSFGSAEAPMARATARHAADATRIHCSSENTENFGDLRARPEQHVSFEVGPFYDLTHSAFQEMVGSESDDTRYDVIFEHTCFQMHHPDRIAPMRIVRRLLEHDGILLIYEKLREHDLGIYQQREVEKDEVFKSRYFSQQEIQAKRSDILTYMEKCQVYLEELVDAIGPVAKYIVMIWRSGNFIGLIASDSSKSITDFLRFLPPPFVENRSYSENLPLQLGKPLENAATFRPSHPVSISGYSSA